MGATELRQDLAEGFHLKISLWYKGLDGNDRVVSEVPERDIPKALQRVINRCDGDVEKALARIQFELEREAKNGDSP